MPRVVSVINYKGGVGKTTVAANIGAELAARGRRVLLMDLDPQASLTFCFYTAEQWETELQDGRSILQWVGSVLDDQRLPLSDFVVTPPRANETIHGGGGRLDLVASHLGLIDADQDLAAELGGTRAQVGSPNYLRVHRMIADGLAEEAFAAYDVVLLDCPPNFGPMTRAGIVASDGILIPARPDYLSTLGIGYLRGKLSDLTDDYNRALALNAANLPVLAPEILGVVVNMVQYASGGQPITAHQAAIKGLDGLEIPVFVQKIRQSNTLFSGSEGGLPVVLGTAANGVVQYELQQLTSEFYARART